MRNHGGDQGRHSTDTCSGQCEKLYHDIRTCFHSTLQKRQLRRIVEARWQQEQVPLSWELYGARYSLPELKLNVNPNNLLQCTDVEVVDIKWEKVEHQLQVLGVGKQLSAKPLQVIRRLAMAQKSGKDEAIVWQTLQVTQGYLEHTGTAKLWSNLQTAMAQLVPKRMVHS